jgi:pimeloyl-ACP methyl ester carboxylesterase
VTDSKRTWEDFEERRSGAVRYYAGGAGEPVVLVHGLGGWAGNWRAVAPLLARSHRVLVPELPGHGGSAPLVGRDHRSLEPYADAVERFLETAR